MTGIRKTTHNIFVWSYARGTIQYDIICALILAFIFLAPRSCFVSKNAPKLTSVPQQSGASGQNIQAGAPR